MGGLLQIFRTLEGDFLFGDKFINYLLFFGVFGMRWWKLEQICENWR
jgi:hypothetical protein